jgi:hypothetical protein
MIPSSSMQRMWPHAADSESLRHAPCTPCRALTSSTSSGGSQTSRPTGCGCSQHAGQQAWRSCTRSYSLSHLMAVTDLWTTGSRASMSRPAPGTPRWVATRAFCHSLHDSRRGSVTAQRCQPCAVLCAWRMMVCCPQGPPCVHQGQRQQPINGASRLPHRLSRTVA